MNLEPELSSLLEKLEGPTACGSMLLHTIEQAPDGLTFEEIRSQTPEAIKNTPISVSKTKPDCLYPG